MKRRIVVCCALCGLLAPSLANAVVTEFVITGSESPTFEGVEFGAVGQYERLKGHAKGVLDPDDPLNAVIVNLDKAPRNGDGLVEYQMDVEILKPMDPSRGNGWLLYDVVNRGSKRAIARLNHGDASNDPRLADHAGTGLLMNRGYTVIWSGWQEDVEPGGGRLLADFPIATDNGAPIIGTSREEFVDTGTDSPFAAALTYPAADLDPSKAVLTVRQGEGDARQVPAGLAWEYVNEREISITRPSGDEFDSGAIYEFIYPAKDPIVMGIGFAATRDLVSFLRNEAEGNPLAVGAAAYPEHTMAFGSSQSGRYLRDFVYQGFNEDEFGRKVFDGVIPHIAGSRKTYTNYEFAQPGRWQRQHEDRLYPGDEFPFSYAEVTDTITGRTDSILATCLVSDTCPNVMHVDGEAEVWQARSSLVVTDTEGNDIDLPENVRMYVVVGTQHGPAAQPEFGICQSLSNPLNHTLVLPAVVVALEEWIAEGREPPASRVGSVAAGTYVPAESASFPAIPGVTYTGQINELRVKDQSVQPPEEVSEAYPVYVSQMDPDGNAVAGLRLPPVAVPTATYTGWNLRASGHAEGDLCGATGSYIPFAKDRAEREAAGDPRLSIEERYPSQGAYVNQVAGAAAKLVAERLLLVEQAEQIIDAAIQSDVELN